MGAPLAAAHVRSRMAAAWQSARVRRAERDDPAAVRSSRGTLTPAGIPHVQPAGRRHRLGVADLLWNPGPAAAVGGTYSAGGDDRVAGNERARRGLRPRIAEH